MSILSIGLPVYNAAEYLDEALQSIVSQEFGDFELIVSDNGSDDQTVEIVESYAKRDERIRLHLSPQNRGAAWNFNNVLALAENGLFKWATHDDLILPGFLEKCVSTIKEAPGDVVLCYPKSYLIDASGEIVSEYEDRMHIQADSASARLRQHMINCRLVNFIFGVWRTDTLRQAGGLGAYAHADRVLLAKAVIAGKFTEIPERLFKRRVHDQSSWRAVGFYEGFETWFDTSRSPRVVFPSWHISRELFRAALGADESWVERARLVEVVAHYWAYRRVGAHTREVLRAPEAFLRSMR